MIGLPLHPSPASGTSAFNKIRAFSRRHARLLLFRISASWSERSPRLDRTTYFFAAISFAAMIASAARVAPKATRQILSTSLKRATRSVLRPPFAPPVMLGLIGDARVAGAIRSLARQFLGAAEAKFRLGRIADRPTAHRLPQFRNGHGFGYRHHNLPHRLGCGGFNHKWVKSEGGIPGDLRTVRVSVGGAPRRLLVRRRSGHIPRTHIDTARQPKPIDLADHCVTGNPAGKLTSNAAGAPSLEPEFLQQLNSFIGPGHRGLLEGCQFELRVRWNFAHFEFN